MDLGFFVDTIHIRLVHLAQKLAGIAGQTLHVATLTLGIDGVEGQTAFSGTTEAGEHHQLISGDGQIHVF